MGPRPLPLNTAGGRGRPRSFVDGLKPQRLEVADVDLEQFLFDLLDPSSRQPRPSLSAGPALFAATARPSLLLSVYR